VDGRSFLSGGDDGRLVRTSAQATCSTLADYPGRQIDVLALSHAIAAVAIGVGKEVHLLDPNGTRRGDNASHPSTVTGIAFNHKGKRLAVAHYGGVTLWWTTLIGQNPTHFEWRGSHIGVSWSPDGAYVVTAMQECELHAWRVATGKDMSMRGYATKVRSIGWLAKPMILASAGADRVVAWPFSGSGPQGKPPLEFGHGIGQLVTQVAVHPMGPLVAAGFNEGRVAICDMTPGREGHVMRLRPGDGSKVSALAWSPSKQISK
jgi:WD40 repeat protein